MEIWCKAVGAFGSNAWLLADPDEKKGILIDPGDEPEALLSWVESKGVELQLLIATHGHLDHVAAAKVIQEKLKIPFAIHPGDLPLLELLGPTRAHYGLPPALPPQVDRELVAGETLSVGALELLVKHCPGHSPGGVIFVAGEHVFTGDLVFKGSVGRTDLPAGNTDELLASIEREVLTLADETTLYPGHGPTTTVGEERRTNPFLGGAI